MGFKMKTGFLSFKIKAVNDKPKRKEKTSYSSLIQGVIVKEGLDDYFVVIKNINDSEVEEKKYKLTEESFNIYDRTVIYSRLKTKRGYIARIRSANDAKLTSGISPIYVPFKPGIKVKGKLVGPTGSKEFDLVDVLYPESYVSY